MHWARQHTISGIGSATAGVDYSFATTEALAGKKHNKNHKEYVAICIDRLLGQLLLLLLQPGTIASPEPSVRRSELS